jgi:O-antigen/teichoic acid export membrane protein
LKVIKNLFWNISYQILILIIPLVSIPYVSRTLGPTSVGIESYTNSIAQYFVLFGGLGLSLYGTREIAYFRDDINKMSQIFWELAITRFIIMLIGYLVYIISILIYGKYTQMFIAEGFWIIGAAFDISWLFQGLEKFQVTVLRNFFVKIVGLFLIFMLVDSSNDLFVYIMIITGSQLVGFLTLFPYLKSTVNIVPLRHLRLAKHIKEGVALFIPQVATQIYLPINKMMLGIFAGVTSSGFYAYSDNIIRMLLAVITAVGTVFLPNIAHKFASGDKHSLVDTLLKTVHGIWIVSVPMMFGLMALAQPFTDIFFGPGFGTVAELIRLESIVVFIIGITNIVGMQYLIPVRKVKVYSSSVVLGSVANVVFNIPLIRLSGAKGAVIGTVIAELVVLLYQLWVERDVIRVSKLFSGLGKYLISGLIMYSSLVFISSRVSEGIISLLAEVLIGSLIYLLCLILVRPSEFIDVLSFLKEKMKL